MKEPMSSRKLIRNRAIGRCTRIGCSGCLIGLPWRSDFSISKSQTSRFLLLRQVRISALCDLTPLLLRNARNADALVINHQSAQITRDRKQRAPDDGERQLDRRNARRAAEVIPSNR